mgnify:CR=1 FL=1
MSDILEIKKFRNKYKWLQRTFRVRNNVIEAYQYLEFLCIRKDIPKYALFDHIVLSSIDYINKNSIMFSIDEYIPRREPKGFTIRDITLDTFYEFVEKKGILVAEAVELLIYVFIETNLSDSEKQLIDTNWGIKLLK